MLIKSSFSQCGKKLDNPHGSQILVPSMTATANL